MKIDIEIPSERIANMMISAMESGDPVTTASKGGWCSGISLVSGPTKDTYWTDDPNWYALPKLWDGEFQVEIVELDDENTGHETTHKIGPADMARGLGVMATKFPHIFQQILRDDTDAPCADLFLQCIVFGDEKYA